MSDDPSVYLRAAPSKGDTAAAFDSKKWLWVPDQEEGFKNAQVLSTKGDKVKVELPDGSVSAASYHHFCCCRSSHTCILELELFTERGFLLLLLLL